MKSILTLLLSSLGLFLLLAVYQPAGAEERPSIVGKDGSISLPKDFRKDMAHLGSWYVPSGDASGFHDVYTQPSSTTGKIRTSGLLLNRTRVRIPPTATAFLRQLPE